MTAKNRPETAAAASHIRPFGWVLGQIAWALGIQQASLTANTTLRSVETYLGGRHVNASTREAIRRQIATQLAEASPLPELMGPDEMEWLIEQHETAWEKLVSSLESSGLAMGEPKHVAIPFVRIAAIDVALRLGCWAALRNLDAEDRVPPLRPPGEWLSPRGCADHLKVLFNRHRPAERESLEDLAEKIGTSTQSLNEWLGAKATPSPKSCIAIADAVDEEDVLQPLLRARAGTLIRWKLDPLMDAHVLADCIAFADRMIPRLEEISGRRVSSLGLTAGRQAQSLFEIPTGGFLHPGGRDLLAGAHTQLDLNEDVALDVHAMSRGEVALARRVECWLQRYASLQQEHAQEFLESLSGHDAVSQTVAQAVWEHVNAGGGYEMCAPGPQQVAVQLAHSENAKVVSVPTPGGTTGLDLLISQSAELRDRGDRVGALAKAKKAVEKYPTSADAHCNYGSLLGMLRLRPSKEDLKAAESVIHIAIQLAPERGDIITELGVILSDQRRHAEAEAAFARAAEVGAKGEHYWMCRGSNLVASDDFVGALRCFEELLADGKGPREAIELSAACLQLLGRKRAASNRWRKVHAWQGDTKLDDVLASKLLKRPHRSH